MHRPSTHEKIMYLTAEFIAQLLGMRKCNYLFFRFEVHANFSEIIGFTDLSMHDNCSILYSLKKLYSKCQSLLDSHYFEKETICTLSDMMRL